ncbi:MAG TPA: Ppx/GppA phosphatase family protein [Polyangiaceae bacterium]|nr:Ppx/GppA phosphatase family protein [Polyangiaceae bacterium]
MPGRRVAAIDIGTNTVLLLVAEESGTAGAKRLRPVLERATITRLGQGVDASGALAADAIERTRVCLEGYAGEISGAGVERVAIVGTSAMRDARGGAELQSSIAAMFGVEARVLTGDEEAHLTFAGAVGGLALPAEDEATVFDVGGGSTEVVIGRVRGAEAPRFARSFDIGSVRLTERHGERMAEIETAVRTALVGLPDLPSAHAPVGVAGTMTTLAAVSLGLSPYDGARVHGHVMPAVEVRRVVRELAEMDIEARRRVPGMEPARSDVIVAGGVIVQTLLALWHSDSVVVSDRGVRWGLAERLLLEPA